MGSDAPQRPVPGAPSDAELLRAVEAGRSHAFDLIVARHGPAIRGYAAHLVSDAAAADDAAQEAFVRLLRAGPGPAEDTSLRVWLLTVVRNIALDQARRGGVRRRFLDRVLSGSDPRRSGRRAPEPTPPQVLESREFGAALAAALAELPEPQRSAFLLRERDGLEYAEIAAVLGCPVKTVSTRLLRARRALRDRLIDLGPEDARHG